MDRLLILFFVFPFISIGAGKSDPHLLSGRPANRCERSELLSIMQVST